MRVWTNRLITSSVAEAKEESLSVPEASTAALSAESGNVEIRMPEFSGVTLEFETVCGSAESDMFGEAAREPVFRSVTFERPAGLSHYLYVTTYSGKLKLYKLS